VRENLAAAFLRSISSLDRSLTKTARNMDDDIDEFAWIEEQEEGVRLSLANLQRQISEYEKQLAALRTQRVMSPARQAPIRWSD
jgi:phage shock protein A